MIKQIVFFIATSVLSLFLLPAYGLPLELLKLPPGFSISIYAHVPDARQMALGQGNMVFVGTKEDKVYALLPNQNATTAQKVIEIATGLNSPNGVAYSDGALYIAEIDKLLKYENINAHLAGVLTTPKVIINDLPKESWHGMRYIKFGPDGLLYMSIGMPCNRCLEEDPRYGTISRVNKDGSGFQIYAKGIRNSMGFDWDPVTKKLWFTDNGADFLGNDKPPDELNFAPEQGLHFGFPFYNGFNEDKKFGEYKNKNIQYLPPMLGLGPHVAALGMTFYRGRNIPSHYQDQILIAEHGSWNRLTKIGYRIMLVRLKNNQPYDYQPFITGWLQGQKNWGRPVDLLVMPDGALLISDDYAGVIYRVAYK